MAHPPCGLYRTTRPIGSIPKNHLVMFHNHGDPGPGVYLPQEWRGNRALFSKRGATLSPEDDAGHLHPLPEEGVYAVEEQFFCCEKECRAYEPSTLVQLGYNRAGEAILFLPILGGESMTFPARGQKIDDDRLLLLKRLRVQTEPAIAAHEVH